MSDRIVQLQDRNDDNIYPVAGAATQGSITKAMLAEGIFEGPELSEPSSVAYVATDNIQDGAVTSDKIDWTTMNTVSDATVTVTFSGVGKSFTIKKIDCGNFVIYAYSTLGETTFTGASISANTRQSLKVEFPIGNDEVVIYGHIDAYQSGITSANIEYQRPTYSAQNHTAGFDSYLLCPSTTNVIGFAFEIICVKS